jgi:hypothetical protein
MTSISDGIVVLGRNRVGIVAEHDGFRYYLTECCGASTKGCDGYIGCRACYGEVDWALGGLPNEDGPLLEVFGDGIPYDTWWNEERS